jgi:hypothetical protein
MTENAAEAGSMRIYFVGLYFPFIAGRAGDAICCNRSSGRSSSGMDRHRCNPIVHDGELRAVRCGAPAAGRHGAFSDLKSGVILARYEC